MRFMPFSYFCTCWNVRPSAFPSFSWLIASICRRIRTRLPTCLSTEFVDFSPTTQIPRATRTFPHASDIGDPQLGYFALIVFGRKHSRRYLRYELNTRGCDGDVRQELAAPVG